LPFRLAAKLAEMAMRLQERVLDDVGGVDLTLKPPADLQARQQGQVTAIPIEQFAARRRVARSGPAQQPVRLRGGLSVHAPPPPRVWTRKRSGSRRVNPALSSPRRPCPKGGFRRGSGCRLPWRGLCRRR